MDRSPKPATRELWTAAMPTLFVVLWSTGFIGAKLGAPDAEPLTFLTIRFALAGAIFLLIVLAWRAPWPASWREAGHIAVAGVLIHAVYLGGVFAAIDLGVEAGVTALIVGIQPLLVGLAAGPLLGERVTGRQWLGLLLGLTGVILVVWRKLSLGLGTAEGMALAGLGLIALTAATLYQKRFCAEMPLRSGNAIQLAAATLATGAGALLFEDLQVTWSGDFIFALAWLVIVLSLGTFTLLFVLIRRGAAAKVASLFFLVPPCTALIAWGLFGERLGALGLLGMALAVFGVALVNLGARAEPAGATAQKS